MVVSLQLSQGGTFAVDDQLISLRAVSAQFGSTAPASD